MELHTRRSREHAPGRDERFGFTRRWEDTDGENDLTLEDQWSLR